MMLTLEICGVEKYVIGTEDKPDAKADRLGFLNWEFNNRYAWGLIINNVTQGVKHHISTCKTAKEMWSNLAAIFEPKAHLTLRAYKRNLESLKADEDTDIIKHLDQLKIYWERIKIRNIISVTSISSSRLAIPYHHHGIILLICILTLSQMTP